MPFYETLADKLALYSDKRGELFEIIKEASKNQPLMKYLHFENEKWWKEQNYQIDPFTIFGVLNRGISIENRITLAQLYCKIFDLSLPKTDFTGIPIIFAMKSWYSGPDEIWNLFNHALEAAKTNIFTDAFKTAFEKAIAVKGNGLVSVTMGLYWISPNFFVSLDANMQTYIPAQYGIKVPSITCSGDEYIQFLKALKSKIHGETTIPELSHQALAKVTAPESTTPEAHNIILCGPPGTGKTYKTVHYAVSLIENGSAELGTIAAEDYSAVLERYKKYKAEGQIEFVTFHQSFGYEEFIEGIRPVVTAEDEAVGGNIKYEIHSGVFKEFCDNAATPILENQRAKFSLNKNVSVWKVSLERTGENPTRTDCMQNNHIRIGWGAYGEVITDETDYSNDGGRLVLNSFYNRMQKGDIVLSCYSSKTIDAIGIIEGEPEWHPEYAKYPRLRKVRWLLKGIEEDIVDINGGSTLTLSSVYKLSVSVSDVLQILKKHRPELFEQENKIPNKVFIIDEFNRGNISKIFGELITLIEPSKRIGAKEELRAVLPYSKQKFGVPNNVHILGTMNTADRSIALIDTALRRRFDFIEMQPEASVLNGITVESIYISKMLEIMNKRIAILLDREHTIGHAIFCPLKNSPTLEKLANIFKFKIVPLLQEYFFDDYEKIRLVLGDNSKAGDENSFIIEKTNAAMLFGASEEDFPKLYEINDAAFTKTEAYEYLQ